MVFPKATRAALLPGILRVVFLTAQAASRIAPGVGPIFGLSGPAVPMVAYVFIDVSKRGPVENLAAGSIVNGNPLL